MNKLFDIICSKYEPVARYFYITRPINKIAKALKLAGYNQKQAEEMAVKIVWNMPSTAINGITYAERNLKQFCDEFGQHVTK